MKLCASKDTFREVKITRNFLVSHISDKGLVSSIYKEFVQLKNKKDK